MGKYIIEKKLLGRSTGQLMIESMVAISMVTIGLLGIITLLVRSSAWNRDVTLKLQATELAVEGIEVAKNIIDTDIAKILSGSATAGYNSWNSTLKDGIYELTRESARGNIQTAAGSPQPLLFDSRTGYGYGGGTKTPLRRSITVISSGADKILVRSEVLWGIPEKKVVLEDVFTFWRKQGGQ